MNTKPHAHYCPHCQTDVACDVTHGGCLFPASADITCNPCAERLVDAIDAKAHAESRALELRQLAVPRVNVPTGRVFMISGFRIPEVS